MPFSPFSVLMLPVRIRQAAVQELSQEFFPHSEAAVQELSQEFFPHSEAALQGLSQEFFPHSEAAVQELSAGPGQAYLPEQAGRQALKPGC